MEGKSVVDEQNECIIYSETAKKQSSDIGSSQDELKKIVQMRALLEKHDPTSKDYYPERLEKLFIVHVPCVFMTVWKMVYSFIDENTEKIVFIENKQLKSTLLKDINEKQPPEIYGGKLKLVPVQDNQIV